MSDHQDARAALEAEIKRHCTAGDFEAAASQILRGYGRELYGFVASTLSNEADAADVFGQFSEELWKSLPRFQWKSSLRTWAYTLARRCAIHHVRSPIRRAQRNVPLSQASVMERLEADARTATAAYLRTEVKDKVARIRERLEPEDRMLLALRVDKELPWNDIAVVTLGDDDAPAEARKRESARLRKRFELVKAKILELSKEEGLLGDG